MRLLILVAAIIPALSLSAFAGTIKKTYFLEVSGDQELGEKLVADLAQKDCYTLKDVHATSTNTSECHIFKKFENSNQVKQTFKKSDSSYLYRVAILPSQNKYNLQIFKRDGGKLRRVFNAGDFTPKGDFYEDLSRTTVSLTFK